MIFGIQYISYPRVKQPAPLPRARERLPASKGPGLIEMIKALWNRISSCFSAKKIESPKPLKATNHKPIVFSSTFVDPNLTMFQRQLDSGLGFSEPIPNLVHFFERADLKNWKSIEAAHSKFYSRLKKYEPQIRNKWAKGEAISSADWQKIYDRCMDDARWSPRVSKEATSLPSIKEEPPKPVFAPLPPSELIDSNLIMFQRQLDMTQRGSPNLTLFFQRKNFENDYFYLHYHLKHPSFYNRLSEFEPEIREAWANGREISMQEWQEIYDRCMDDSHWSSNYYL